MHVRNEHRPDVDPTAPRRDADRHGGEAATGCGGRLVDRERTGKSSTGERPTRKEIDFVSDDLGGAADRGRVAPRERWRPESATVNASEWRGVLATRNMLDTGSPDKAWAVPAAMLAYLIDT